MNTYTLDPPKPEATAAPAPASATVPASAPVYSPYIYQHNPYQHPAPRNVQSDIHKIRDWLPWSIISLFVGALIPGFLPLVFSLICRNNKKHNEPNSARKMSNLALIFNIIITILAASIFIGLFVYLLVFTNLIKNHD